MQEKKVVFLDIDGTILNDSKEIPKSTKTAVSRLHEQGIHVAIATGRGPTMLQAIMKELGMTSYVSFNGSYVVLNGDVVYTEPLSKNKMIELELSAKQQGHPMVFLSEKDMYANHEDHPFIHEGMGSLKQAYPEYHATFHRENDIYQALLFLEEKDTEWAEVTHDHFDYVRWHKKAVDVLPKGGSKAKGIQEMLKVMKVSPENTYAFGDGLNDIEMLQYVGTGVAMGNAVPEAKQAAKFVTKHVEEDGVYHGLLELGLLKG
ncbi:hypothetical protein SAMN05421736_103300 [Evansella caseinilytica]|uniref:Cof subfamily protein (Haloacid dehalogenase superfamily)/HAD superfamily hydrolase (TIGR01484 family) n=1 Tax=Evansella caseinilytica TaxID=1503961 RepID=A0A1H3MPP6_9BACI|nr:Cof-type HAD-IIB family hydrolase [Evansella caseinilytica]SDY78631.1 hypothetical protein SAMN05421736_103300 [Evansella caseinilytica]